MKQKLLLALLLACNTAHTESIPLIREHGILMVPVVINDKITLNFTIDSGASDVSIPADVFSTLTRTGTISKKDLLGTQDYELADGSQQSARRFRIRSLRIGNLELQDVTASVAPSAGSLLLGQSFLERFKYWSIDNQRHLMLINESPGLDPNRPSIAPPTRASSMPKPRAAVSVSSMASLGNSVDRAQGILVTENPSGPEAHHQTLAEKVVAEDRMEEESLAGIHHHHSLDDIDWTKYLDPLAGGGWDLRYKGIDGSWALFTSDKRKRRVGQLVTIWLRWEQSVQQKSPTGVIFLSYLEKIEYDCTNEQVRTLAQTIYPESNLGGNPQTLEVDPKTVRWASIIPGTQGETNFHIACADR